MEKRFIYADNAATTAVSERVLKAMLPYFTEQYGNPSSIYKLGRDAQRAVEDSREKVAAALGCTPPEIYFTSCGTESDNWAIRSTALRLGEKGKKHIITTNVEHHAVLHTCEYLAKQGFEITYLPVDSEGLVTAEQVADAIREDTALVTIMYANNEIGTVMPIAEIGKVCREKGVLFHTDAVQAVGNVPIDVKAQNIDMLSLSGHKIHAQKGIGALYVRKGVPLPNLTFGGGQERGKRPGTENVPAIVGLGEAITAACEDIPGKTERVTRLRNKIIDGVLEIEGSRLNGNREKRLPGNINISFLGVEGESLLLLLDTKGICASSGSACTSGSLDPSHVLLALGLPHEVAHGSMRLSISAELTDDDADYIIAAVKQVVERLRNMSPMWEDIISGKEHTEKLLKFVSEIKSKS
ncbi:MAG: cysteine desulfurase NifS [Oscillospiraceae bacterium]|nr:cysteine desulfurase NifS [Oscillospiraceae bacterium]